MSKMGRYIVDSMERFGYVKALPDCPDANTKQFYPYELCSLNDKMCVRESGYDCPYYNEWLEELQKEEDEEKELLSYWD